MVGLDFAYVFVVGLTGIASLWLSDYYRFAKPSDSSPHFGATSRAGNFQPRSWADSAPENWHWPACWDFFSS